MIRETLAAALLAGALVSPAAAQGNGHGHGHAYGQLKSSTSAPSGGGAAQIQPAIVAGVRNFGSWLDDASMMEPGAGSLTLSFGWYRSPLFHEFDAPVADGGIGLTRRVQFGFSVPYYHMNEPGGPVFRGLGDLYLTSKVQLREPSADHGGVGFAVVPVVARPYEDFLWQRHPFALKGGGDGCRAAPALDFLLPYWMARFYGVIPNPA